MNAFRYFGYKSLAEVECMTLAEYLFRMKAYTLSRADEEYDMHLQAWLNNVVSSTEQKGDKLIPRYKTFKDFFNYEKRVQSLEGVKKAKLSDQQRRMAEIASQINK